MTRILLALLVIAVWLSLTAIAAWAMPTRQDDSIDLVHDPHWNLNIPTDPVEPDKLPARPTTTKAPPPAPRRVVPPRPPPAPRVTTRPNTTGVEQWRGLVAQYPWPVETMLAIMRCESGGDPTNYNGRSRGIPWSRWRASGLFQLYPAPPGWEDPATNIRLAYEMKYEPSGLSPWVSSRSCWG